MQLNRALKHFVLAGELKPWRQDEKPLTGFVFSPGSVFYIFTGLLFIVGYSKVVYGYGCSLFPK